MQFLKLSDFYNIKSHLLNDITSDTNVLNLAENIAIETISNYLRSKYDTDFEFRSYHIFEKFKIYDDYARVLCVKNDEDDEWSSIFNITLLNNIYDDTILTINPNKIEKTKTSYYNISHNNRSYDNFDRTFSRPISTNVNDIDYKLLSIQLADRTVKIDKKKNMFNTIYSESTSELIDYTTILHDEFNNYYNNINHFDQYQVYDVTKDDRNPTLIKLCIDLTLNELLSRVSPHDISDNYKQRFIESMQLLDDIARGRANVNIKKLDYAVAENTGSAMRWGNAYTFKKNEY